MGSGFHHRSGSSVTRLGASREWLRSSYPMLHLTCLAASAQRIMSTVVKPTIVFVLGGPGAGKGTQCEKIVKVNELTRDFLQK